VADYDEGLQIISVSDPSSPYLLGSYDTPSYAWGVFVQDSLACVADYGSGLQIISVSDPSNPHHSGSCDTPGNARQAFGQGKYVHVADSYSLIILETPFGIWRGDVNGDGLLGVGDVVYLINFVLKDGPAPDPLIVGDCNCDGIIDLDDVIFLIQYLFMNGSPPVC
jgi:hypothetical protein